MASFILIHGAWHGAWCWHKVTDALSAAGHHAVAIDLPSHGDDLTPPAGVTLRDYADRIGEAIDEHSEPVVLVGHSMGGLAISQAAESKTDKIRSLVYLTAMLPSPGDTKAEAPDAAAVQDLIESSDDPAAVAISLEGSRGVFYGDCSEEDISLAFERLRPQAVGVFDCPLELSPEKFGSVPRYYIECLNDLALTPKVQRRMIERTPCRKVYSLNASHSPFFSMPGELGEILCEIAAEG